MFGIEKYPDDWKIACLKFLREKRENLRLSIGHKRLGWGPIRNLIMEPYDEIVRGEIVVASDLLNESTLEAWDRRGDSSITDAKFRFVDDYVRSLAIEGKDSAVIEIMREQRFRTISDSLFAAYNPRSINSSSDDGEESLPTWTEKSQLWELPGARHCIAIRFMAIHRRSFHVICAVMPYFDSRSELPDPRDIVFYEGVAIPVGAEVYHEDSLGHVITHYLVKLFREEFSGVSALGYAEGDMQVSSLPDHNADIRIDLYDPTSWFRPKIVLPLDPLWVDQFTKDTERPFFQSEELKSAVSEKLKDRGRYGFITSWNNNTENIDFIFDNYYEGYM